MQVLAYKSIDSHKKPIKKRKIEGLLKVALFINHISGLIGVSHVFRRHSIILTAAYHSIVIIIEIVLAVIVQIALGTGVSII